MSALCPRCRRHLVLTWGELECLACGSLSPVLDPITVAALREEARRGRNAGRPARQKPTKSRTALDSVYPSLGPWIRGNAPDVLSVLDWLRRNPADFNTIAQLTRIEVLGDAYQYTSGRPESAAELARQDARIGEYFRSAKRGGCSRCFAPTVQFCDGLSLDWPITGVHDCVGFMASEVDSPEPVAFPAPVQARGGHASFALEKVRAVAEASAS